MLKKTILGLIILINTASAMERPQSLALPDSAQKRAVMALAKASQITFPEAAAKLQHQSLIPKWWQDLKKRLEGEASKPDPFPLKRTVLNYAVTPNHKIIITYKDDFGFLTLKGWVSQLHADETVNTDFGIYGKVALFEVADSELRDVTVTIVHKPYEPALAAIHVGQYMLNRANRQSYLRAQYLLSLSGRTMPDEWTLLHAKEYGTIDWQDDVPYFKKVLVE